MSELNRDFLFVYLGQSHNPMGDRLLVEVGKEQLYGTQWKFQKGKKVPHPIKNPENVDQRRAEIGLGPLQNYLKERFNIIWHVEQEKKE